MVRKNFVKIFSILTAIVLLSAGSANAAGVNLIGGGATFANPILDACKAEYARESGNSYVYNSLGSGAGRSGIDKGDFDFGWSDTPHLGTSAPAGMMHLPVVAAPVAIMYNLPGVTKSLIYQQQLLQRFFLELSQCGMTQLSKLITIGWSGHQYLKRLKPKLQSMAKFHIPKLLKKMQKVTQL